MEEVGQRLGMYMSLLVEALIGGCYITKHVMATNGLSAVGRSQRRTQRRHASEGWQSEARVTGMVVTVEGTDGLVDSTELPSLFEMSLCRRMRAGCSIVRV